MNRSSSQLVFKVASEAGEIEQIQQLLYRTFVEEIPQHPPNPEQKLVDRFHAENTYLIGMLDGRVIATIALRGKRPFSLDSKITDLDRHLPSGHTPAEVRLLAVEPEFRRTAVFAALLEHCVRHALGLGFDLVVISGTTRQIKLYEHLGFRPFGPLVGTPGAMYQPMSVTLDQFSETAHNRPAIREMLAPRLDVPNALNFLPGPISPTAAVRSAFATPPISHRSREFLAQLAAVRSRLCRISNALDVQVIVGSGSLANELIAAQLSLDGASGLVLSNGEFGERLAGQARRAQLRFEWLRDPWGGSYDRARVSAAIERVPRGGWVWFTHHETSTGILNPLRELVDECAARGLRACIDCVSSLGAVPVDLRGVHLASATSGKALGSYPGLALVFHAYVPEPQPERLPGYLDLGHWASHDSVPHTHSSNLIAALGAALREVTPERMARIAAAATWLRGECSRAGFSLVSDEADACPAIVTLVPPPGVCAFRLGEQLDRRGFWTSYRSSYLVERGWLQVALLGDPPRDSLERLVRAITRLASRPLPQQSVDGLLHGEGAS